MHVKEIALMANTAAGVHKERGKNETGSRNNNRFDRF